MYYVSMTRIRKLIPEKLVVMCKSYDSARNIYDCANFMFEFGEVSLSTTKPHFSKRKYAKVEFKPDDEFAWKPTRFRIEHNIFCYPTEEISYAQYV